MGIFWRTNGVRVETIVTTALRLSLESQDGHREGPESEPIDGANGFYTKDLGGGGTLPHVGRSRGEGEGLLCQAETDKATVGFEFQDEAVPAKIFVEADGAKIPIAPPWRSPWPTSVT